MPMTWLQMFCKMLIENGIDVVRIFDALNDPRNMETAMKYVKEYGGKAEAAISYTKESPVAQRGLLRKARYAA